MKIAISLLLLTLSSLIFSDTIEVWHRWNKEESISLIKNISKFEAITGNKVILKYFDYKIISSKFISATKLNTGPDLIITKASMIEIFANNGLLNPINDYITFNKRDEFIKNTLDDAYINDKLYGLPVTYKLLALIYNKDIIQNPPQNTNELFKIGHQFTNMDKGFYGFAYPVEDYYYHIPWITGYNGILIKEKNVYFNSIAHKNALNFARSLQLGDNAIMPEGVNYDLMLSLFIEGRVPMIINGTWIIGNLIKEGMNVAATRIPKNSETGLYPKPYATSELIMMSKFSKYKNTAYMLMNYLTSEEAQLESTKIGHLPTISSVYELKSFKDGVTYNILSGFRNQAEVAIKEPKDEIMSKVVWSTGDSILHELLYDTDSMEYRLNRFQKDAVKMINKLE